MKRIIILNLITFYSLTAYTQHDSIFSYFDDGGRSKSKDIIKTDLSEYLKSNISIIWEHRFDNYFALQSGLGLLIYESYNPLLIPRNKLNDKTFNSELNNGLCFLITPKLYTNGFETMHMGLPFKFRYFPKKVVSYELCITYGKQWFASRRLAIDIELGFGLNFEKSLDGKSYIFEPSINNTMKTGFEDTRLVYPLSIKIGYIL